MQVPAAPALLAQHQLAGHHEHPAIPGEEPDTNCQTVTVKSAGFPPTRLIAAGPSTQPGAAGDAVRTGNLGEARPAQMPVTGCLAPTYSGNPTADRPHKIGSG